VSELRPLALVETPVVMMLIILRLSLGPWDNLILARDVSVSLLIHTNYKEIKLEYLKSFTYIY
jgi:hypothetical protein